jgi:hypothetical protein
VHQPPAGPAVSILAAVSVRCAAGAASAVSANLAPVVAVAVARLEAATATEEVSSPPPPGGGGGVETDVLELQMCRPEKG